MMKKITILLTVIVLIISCTGCGSSSDDTNLSIDQSATSYHSPVDGKPSSPLSDSPGDSDNEKGTRDNTPQVLVPSADGKDLLSCSVATVDISNVSKGYIMVKYTGSCQKVKLQITCPSPTGSGDAVKYTYNLTIGADYEAFPLTTSGDYTIGIYENVKKQSYKAVLSESKKFTIKDEFGPYLYPNQYIWFDDTYKAVIKAEDLAYSASDDLDVVENIYDYIITNTTYDHALAETVASGYLPNVDTTLSTKKGICLDYSALMCAMLRSQGIPTRLEVGYAGDAYHAWISTYLEEIGWVSGIIYFNGTSWSLMDPTFASSTNPERLKEYIGDGDNYTVKYVY